MPLPSRPLRIGTRGSPMALSQTRAVRDRLVAAHPELAAPDAVEIVTIRTTGDRVQNRPLAEIGGKGLFAKEIDEGLPDGIVIACIPPRDDPRDALLSPRWPRLDSLPKGAVVGTASLRRQAQLLHHRPDLKVVALRGNAGTRIRKLDAGEVDATLLALSGLQRIGCADRATEILPREIMLPAVGQGALAVECRAADEAIRALLAPLDDPPSAACATAERALLAALDGSCHTPIAALAEIEHGALTIEGLLLTPDGSRAIRARRTGAVADAALIGAELGAELRARAGPEFGLGRSSGLATD